MAKKKETVVEEVKEKKGRGRPKKTLEQSLTETKKPKKKVAQGDNEEIASLDEIKEKLLKKCKSDGFIDQSEIYEAFEDYELDDDAIQELISFFASHYHR